MDYAGLASELLRELRGARSQAALMRRLGYRANAPYLWEAGRRFPPARVLFQLTALNKIPLEAVVAFAGAPVELAAARSWGPRETSSWLSKLVGETPATEIARAIGSDRTTVSRWLNGRTEPRLPELLELVDHTTHRLVEFVALFVEIERMPSLRRLARELAAQRRIAYDVPWTHAVLRALELTSYRQAPGRAHGVLAHAIGVSEERAEELLDELRCAGLIRLRKGKWAPARVLTVDTRSSPDRDRLLKLHWAEVAVERLRAGPIRPEAFYSFNLCALSRDDFERVREIHLEYYERVRRIVAESKVADVVVLLNQQLLPLDSVGSASPPALSLAKHSR